MKTKTCTKCKIEKFAKEFSKNKNTFDELGCWCKSCTKRYKETHKEEIINYRKSHQQEIKKYQQEWYLKNKKNRKNRCKCGKLKCMCSKTCIDCYIKSFKGKDSPNYKDGRCSKKYKCKVCHKKKIHWMTYLYQGRMCASCSRKGKNNSFFGKKHTKNSKKKMSLIKGGTGIPYENAEYPKEFNEKLKAKILNRDNYTCQKCGMTKKEHFKKYNRNLEVHHKDHNRKNCKEDNLITYCKKCNLKDNYD